MIVVDDKVGVVDDVVVVVVVAVAAVAVSVAVAVAPVFFLFFSLLL